MDIYEAIKKLSFSVLVTRIQLQSTITTLMMYSTYNFTQRNPKRATPEKEGDVFIIRTVCTIFHVY